MCPQSLPFKWDLFKLRLPHIINQLLLCAAAAETNTGDVIMGGQEQTAERRQDFRCQSLPESEGGASCEEHRLGLGLGLLEEAEKGVVFHTDLPEDFTAVSAGHQKLQSVLI